MQTDTDDRAGQGQPSHSGGGYPAATEKSVLPAELRALYPFKSRFLAVGEEPHQHRLHYIDEGPREDPVPVVFVHGNPSWSFLFREPIRHLVRAGRRCIALDHLGMGLSDKPQAFPYVLQNHIDHLRACLDHLRLENFDLVVHDWGGPIGLGAALEAPRQLRRVVITNTAAWPSERIPWRIALCRLPILGDIIIRGFNGFAGAATRMAVSGQLPPAVRFGYTWPYGTWTNRIATLRFVQDIPKSPGHPSWDRLKDLENRLSALREKAALLWWGGQDFCFDDAFLSEWQAVLPGAGVHRLPGAGHYVFEEADEADYRVLTEFLTNAQVPRRGVGPDGTRL